MPTPHRAASMRPSLPRARILERPDGFYWTSESGADGRAAEYGPFATLLATLLDMQGQGTGAEQRAAAAPAGRDGGVRIDDWVEAESGGTGESEAPRWPA